MTASEIARVKSLNPLAAAVEATGVELSGRGRLLRGVCPFHAESEGSFTIYDRSQRWYCFGCGAGGDVLDFIGRTEGISLREVMRRLKGTVAPPIRATGSAGQDRPGPDQPREAEVHMRDRAALTFAARHYAGQLRRSQRARRYLAERGIAPSAAARLGLGYAPGRGLRRSMEDAGFTPQRLSRSGLFTGRGERFAGTIIVPDVSGGSVRWLGGRAISPEASPRFQALPGLKPVLGLAALGPRPPWVVVAEGLFDWIVLAGWKVPACAALGTHGERRIASALRGCAKVLVAFDSDDAGRSGAQRLCAALGQRASSVTLPSGASDVADLATVPAGRAALGLALRAAAAPPTHRQ